MILVFRSSIGKECIQCYFICSFSKPNALSIFLYFPYVVLHGCVLITLNILEATTFMALYIAGYSATCKLFFSNIESWGRW